MLIAFIICVSLFEGAEFSNIADSNNEYSELHDLIEEETFPLPNGRIVGGVGVDITKYPYQLSLMYKGRHMCGASLIDFKWAITAAHCTRGLDKNLLSIRAGSSLRNTGGQVVKIEEIHQHPLYSPTTIDFDISLLKLEEQVTIWSAKPIALPNESVTVPVGTLATIAGWGLISEKRVLVPNLQAVKIPVISSQSCQKAYPFMSITPRMFCAGFLGKGGKDGCQGDSGGGLVIGNVLMGIVSWGFGCARPQYPGVYSSIPALIGFINSVIWEHKF